MLINLIKLVNYFNVSQSNINQKLIDYANKVKEANELLLSNELDDSLKKTLLLSMGDYSMMKNISNAEDIQVPIKTESINGITLNYGQKTFLEKLTSEDNYSLSMPTSFGKSFLVREATKIIIEKTDYKVVLIVPTLALLYEYSNALSKSKPTTIPNYKNKLNLLTQERASYFSFTKKHFVIIDEAYESSDDGERSVITAKIIKKAVDQGARVKMLSPNLLEPLEIIPEPIKNKFQGFAINTTLTSREVISVNSFDEIDKTIFKENKTIIIESKDKMINLALKISDFKTIKNICNVLIDKFLVENYSEHFIFIKLLKNGIGIHHGDMPKDIRCVTELLFKNSIIDILIANTTITQGVNLNANNLILNSKGTKARASDFYCRNLIGRVGRYSPNSKSINLRHGRVWHVSGIPGFHYDKVQKANSKLLLEFDKNEVPYIQKLKSEDGTFTTGKPNKDALEYSLSDISKLKNMVSNHREMILSKEGLYNLKNLAILSDLLWNLHISLIKKSREKFETSSELQKTLKRMMENYHPFKYVEWVLDAQIKENKILVDVDGSKISIGTIHKWDAKYSKVLAERLMSENRKRSHIRDVLMLKLTYLIKNVFNDSNFELDLDAEKKMDELSKNGLPEALINSAGLNNADVLLEFRTLANKDK